MPLPAGAFLPQRPVRFRRRALLAAQRALYWSGVGHAWYRLRRTEAATILMFHSVADDRWARDVDPRNRIEPAIFRRQAEFLARHRHVVPLTQLVDSLQTGEGLTPGTVVLTFDDGYLDNGAVAAPILSSLGLPATIFLPTGLIDRGESPWADRLYTAFVHSSQSSLEVGSRTLDLGSPGQAREAYLVLADQLREAAPGEVEPLIRRVADQLGVDSDRPRLLMNWDEIRDLRTAHSNIEFGVHTHNHIDLSTASPEDVRAEIEKCVDRFTAELGAPPVHFAYPYNRETSVAREILIARGIRSAVTSRKDFRIFPGDDPLSLPRLDVPLSPTLFRLRTQGILAELRPGPRHTP